MANVFMIESDNYINIIICEDTEANRKEILESLKKVSDKANKSVEIYKEKFKNLGLIYNILNSSLVEESDNIRLVIPTGLNGEHIDFEINSIDTSCISLNNSKRIIPTNGGSIGSAIANKAFDDLASFIVDCDENLNEILNNKKLDTKEESFEDFIARL